MQALERSYDGIIIGAGHHGLVLGSYLARAGLKILLVERRLTYGGGLSTREVTQPGFYHNLHSINHFHITETPWFKDLGLEARVTYITPRYEFGQAHLDGTALVLGRDLEETIANIARFSRKDAATFRDWNRKAEEITAQHPDAGALCRAAAAGRARSAAGAAPRSAAISSRVTRRQPLDVVDELFENEHVKLLFLFKVSLFGTWLTDTLSKTSPMGSVIRAFDLQSGYQLCQGGSFNLARGLMETFIAAGGTFVPQVAHRAHRDRRRPRDRHRARRRPHRAGEAVRRQHHRRAPDLRKPDRARRSCRSSCKRSSIGFQYTAWTLFGLHLALHESPRFAAEAFDPNINRALKWSIGADTMADLFSAHRDVQAGRVPSLVQFGSGPLSLIDPTQAPPGKHTTYAWHVMPLDPDTGGNDYEDFKEEFSEKILQTWARYCPNMTSKNIIGQYAYTAREYVAEFPNMRGGDIFMGAFNAEQVMYNHFGYRTPIPNLYYAGSAAHPGGAISGGSGYISAGIIARDLGVEPWWKPWDARAALASEASGQRGHSMSARAGHSP